MGGWAFPGSRLPDDGARGDAGDGTDDGRGPLPGGACGDRGAAAGDDADDGHFEWLVREMGAGRLLPPPQYAAEGPAVSVSLGDACDLDPGLLAAVCGPDGLGGQAALAAFGEGRAVDTLRPGPVLAALTAQPSPGSPPGRAFKPAPLRAPPDRARSQVRSEAPRRVFRLVRIPVRSEVSRRVSGPVRIPVRAQRRSLCR